MSYCRLRRLFLPMVFGLLLSTCNALEFTWFGVISEDWNQPGNWTPAGVPTTNDTVVINSGTVTAPGNAAYAVLNLNGGTLNGAFTVATTMNWSGGTLGGGAALTVATNGTLNLNGTAIKRLFGTITNTGLATWTGAGGFFFYDGTLVNSAGGTFDVQNDQAFSLVNGTPVFHNVGLLRKSAGTNTTTFNGVTFINSGTVDVQTGIVNFSGLSTFASGSVLTGPGLKRWSGGTVTLNRLIS